MEPEKLGSLLQQIHAFLSARVSGATSSRSAQRRRRKRLTRDVRAADLAELVLGGRVRRVVGISDLFLSRTEPRMFQNSEQALRQECMSSNSACPEKAKPRKIIPRRLKRPVGSLETTPLSRSASCKKFRRLSPRVGVCISSSPAPLFLALENLLLRLSPAALGVGVGNRISFQG